MVIELGHRKGDTTRIAELPYEQLRAMVFESVGPIRHEVSVPFHDSQVRGAALLIQTGWDRHWGTRTYVEAGPFLGDHVIFRMVRSGVRVVGVDFPVSNQSPETRLITTGKIPIVENLCGFAPLPRVGFRFSAIPLEAFPGGLYAVHAFAEIA
jgi:arylformamidase